MQTNIFPSGSGVAVANAKTSFQQASLSNYPLMDEGGYKFIETKGGRQNLLLLHGLFGSLSNFSGIIRQFGNSHNVIVPMLPLFEISPLKLSIPTLVDHVAGFVKKKNLEDLHLVGNSLGGHIALLYALDFPQKAASLTLTGSSGLYENAFGSSFPLRGSYDYIREKTESIFYDPSLASKDLVDEVFDTVNDRRKVLNILATAKSAIRNNLRDRLGALKLPTLLVWGHQDKVTPIQVGQEFNRLIPQSQLVVLNRCGHVPMMEQPDTFNTHLGKFISQIGSTN